MDKGAQSLALVQPYEPPLPPSELSQDDLRLLKETVTQGLTDAEFRLFVRACQHMRLDPFQKQIHAIKRGGRLTIQTSIDGFRLIADRTNRYAPGQATTYTYDGGGGLESATAYVRKFAGGTWHDVAETAYWSEFCPQKGQDHMWKKMPHVMLSKVAEARALRRAFPAELAGAYTDDEMEQAPAESEVVGEHEVKGEPRRLVDASVSMGALQGYFTQLGFEQDDRALRMAFARRLLPAPTLASFRDLTDEERVSVMRKTRYIASSFSAPEMTKTFAAFCEAENRPLYTKEHCKAALADYFETISEEEPVDEEAE